MSQNVCCVPGCLARKEDGIPLHQFPNPETYPEKFNIWISNIGGDLSTLDIKTICNNRRVCHNHFEDIHKYPKNKLCKLATPVLHLPGEQARRIDGIEQIIGECSQRLKVGDTPNIEQPRNIITSGLRQSRRKESIKTQDDTTQRVLKTKKQKKSKGCYVSLTQVKQYKIALNKLKKCESEKLNFKRKYLAATKFMRTTAFQRMCKQHMSPTAKILFQMQITQSKKKKQGRRFTIDEKILALSLYKPSPKAYRLLSKLCVMPSRRTLYNLLQKIDLKAGVNEVIFENLTNSVVKMPESHKYCSLLFDEMAIGSGIFYDKKHDKLSGFVDNGRKIEKEFCDHVLVFMVRGIVKKYKQPLAYYFCAGSTKTLELKKQITEIITKLHETGLKVKATVCDQGTSNIAAINSLIKETQEKYLRKNQIYPEGIFEIGNSQIFPIFDPPHLIKGIRNNLINKNLKYNMKGKEGMGKWSHIVALYNRSPGYQGVKLVPKLTAYHVLPDLIPKMRVKYCTQVFSKSVGVALGFMAELGVIEKESTETADLLMFFDDLFDSVNGSYSEVKGGKIYRAAVTPTSPHHKLWNESLKVLESMKFISAYNQGVVPSLTSWIKTVKNFQKLTKYLSDQGIKSLLLRNINQDALENFFGAIRAHGCSNIMPNASAFESAFKTLLINNISSPHSVGSNCEKDDSFCLHSLKRYLSTAKAGDNSITECEDEIDSAHICMTLLNTDALLVSSTATDIEKSAAIGYCSGWIAQQAKKNIFKNCDICQNDLISEDLEKFHLFIKKKEFENKKWLCYPTRALFDFFAQVENITLEILKTQSNRNNILTYIKLIVNVNISTTFLKCITHQESMKKYLIDKSTMFFINNWCKETNNILTGNTITPDPTDPIKQKALRHYSRNKGRKRKPRSV